MSGENKGWMRQGEAFWRAYQEAWKCSDLNQRAYCEAHKLPLKAFGDRREKFRGAGHNKRTASCFIGGAG